MHRRTFLIATVLLAASPALAAEDDPVAVVREIYRVHGEGEKTKQRAGLPPTRERFFTR